MKAGRGVTVHLVAAEDEHFRPVQGILCGHWRDPHACIPPYTKVSDLFNYDFNSGSGPHDLVVGNDIASFTFSTSPCTAIPL